MSYFPRFHDFPRKRRGKNCINRYAQCARAGYYLYLFFRIYLYIYAEKQTEIFGVQCGCAGIH